MRATCQYFCYRTIIIVSLLSIVVGSIPVTPTRAQHDPRIPAASQPLFFPLIQSQTSAAPVLDDTTGANPVIAAVRPNIILILMDDLDVELMTHLPGLKALLADRGTSFRNSFVSTPLCCPSRITLLRGQYSHNTGVLNNQYEYQGSFSTFYQLGRENSTVATWLHDAGYHTGMMGKYLNNYPDYAPTTYIPPGWDEWYGGYEENLYKQYFYSLNENGVIQHYGGAPGHYLGDVLANKAVDFIQRMAGTGSPFFLYFAPTTPHTPAPSAPRHTGAFQEVSAPRSPSFNEVDVSDKPSWVRARPLLSPAAISEIDKLYRRQLQSMLAVEETVQRIIDTLTATNQLQNTYIVFTSDNGFHRGEHRLQPNKRTAYVEDIRVPLIVRGPGVPAGRVLDHAILNTDFAPTFAMLAGVPVPPFVDGRSFVPLLGSSPPPFTAWRRNVLIELIEHWDGNLSSRPDYRAVWTGTYEYVEYAGSNERELYDLQSDPYQLNSLHATADRALLTRLSELSAELSKCSGAGCRTLEDTPLYVPVGKPDSSLFWGDLYHNAAGQNPQQELVPGGTCTFRCADGAGNYKISLLVALGDITSAYVRYGSANLTAVPMTRLRVITAAFHGQPSRAYAVWNATIPAGSAYDIVVNDGCTSAVLKASQGLYQNPLGQWVQYIDTSGGVSYATGGQAGAANAVAGEQDISANDATQNEQAVMELPLHATLFLPLLHAPDNSDNLRGRPIGDNEVVQGGEFALPHDDRQLDPDANPARAGLLADEVQPLTIDSAQTLFDAEDKDFVDAEASVSTEAAWRAPVMPSWVVPLSDTGALTTQPLYAPIDSFGPPVQVAALSADAASLGTNLLLNGSFEQDVDNDGTPDQWTRDSHASRSSNLAYEGSYAIELRSTSNFGFAVSQVVPNIVAGIVYEVGGWVNIPPSADTNSELDIEVRWLNANQIAISTSHVKSYISATAGWDHAVAQMLAPHGTVSAEVRLVTSWVNNTMYVDQFSFRLVNLISNAGFEVLPATGERPAGWSADINVSCSDRSAHTGRYAMRHSPLQDANYTVSQEITQLTGGSRYQIAAWVNIPPTQDTFQFDLQVRWRDANQTVLSTTTLRTYSTATSGWDLASGSLLAPARTLSAQLLLVASDLRTTIFVDDLIVQPGALLANSNLELDRNNDTRPDSWFSDAHVTRSGTMKHSGRFAMLHHATDDANYTISQDVAVVYGAHAYTFDAWVNIPPTSDAFRFDLQIRWKDAGGGALMTTTVKRYSAATSGWKLASATLTPPLGALTVQVLMVASSLKADIYVDDVSLQVGNLLANGSFESDSDADGRPDNWTPDSHVALSNVAAHYDAYSMQHAANDEAGYTVSQDVAEVLSRSAYRVVCDVNVPPTTDKFSLLLRVQWLKGTTSRGVSTVAFFSGATNGWVSAGRTLVSPVSTTSARFEMVVSGLSTTVFVDGCIFSP